METFCGNINQVINKSTNVLEGSTKALNTQFFLQDLQRFIEGSLDLYRHELALIEYVTTFKQEDIKKLSYITKREHMRGSELMENFRTSQFTVRMSRDTYTQLRQQKKFMSGN